MPSNLPHEAPRRQSRRPDPTCAPAPPPAEDPRPWSARSRILRLMRHYPRPFIGSEIHAYALYTWTRAEVDGVLAGLVADGLLTFTEAMHRGSLTRSYSLAEAPAAFGEGGGK